MRFSTRLVIYYLLAALLAIALVGFGIARSIQYAGMRAVEKELISQSESAITYIQQKLFLEVDQSIMLKKQVAQKIANSLSAGNRQVRIYDGDLDLLAAAIDGVSQQNPRIVGGDERLESAIQGDYSYIVRNNKVYFAAPIRLGTEIVGVLEFVYPLNLLNRILTATSQVLLIGSVFFIFLMTVFTLLISTRMMRPVKQLVDATRRYAQRDFTPIGIHGTDEFAQLGRRFNYMGTQLQEYIERQRHFVSNVSHELSVPLTAIQQYATFLQDGVRDEPELEKAARHLKKESERLSTMVEGLLLLARVDSREELFLTRLNLSVLLQEGFRRMKVQAQKRSITMESKIEPDLYVAADEGKMLQVLMNLLDNAIKYSPVGGVIQVELTKEKDQVMLIVQDRGKTIPKEDLDKIFERFYRASNVEGIGGTGLGLAIAKEFITAHQGNIQVSQRAGGGTVVTVHLPLLKK